MRTLKGGELVIRQAGLAAHLGGNEPSLTQSGDLAVDIQNVSHPRLEILIVLSCL